MFCSCIFGAPCCFRFAETRKKISHLFGPHSRLSLTSPLIILLRHRCTKPIDPVAPIRQNDFHSTRCEYCYRTIYSTTILILFVPSRTLSHFLPPQNAHTYPQMIKRWKIRFLLFLFFLYYYKDSISLVLTIRGY